MNAMTSSSSRRRRPAAIRRRLSFAALLLVGFLACGAWNDAFLAVSASASAEASSEASSSEPPKEKRGVIVLDAKNFDSSLRDGRAWLIEFYAPWCGHCTRFAAAYETVAVQLHAEHGPSPPKGRREVSVAKVDGAAERALASRFGVNAFPTFFLVDGWTVREFDGTRSSEGLVRFATKEYEEVEPVPFLFGPFGPMGQLKGWLMRSGTWAVGMYERLTKERGMSPLVAMAALCVGGLAAGLVAIVLVGILFLPKAKQD